MEVIPADTASAKILVIDDEDDVLNFLSYNLQREGYEVITAANGKDGLQIARREHPNLILLDVMMPDMDGIEVCRSLREDSHYDDILVAFLTARGEDYTQVAALDHGGDDFIVKPIKPTVLKSRLKALLRRNRKLQTVAEATLHLGDLVIDRQRFTVVLKGELIEMARKEFQILELLMTAPGKVFSRQEIFRKIWHSDIIVGERTIDVHIRRIREKVGDQYIKTLKGIGYKIVV